MTEDRVSLVLWNPQQAYQSVLNAWAWAKVRLITGQRLILELRPENRSDKQNRLLHSRINDIRKHCEWAGKARDLDTWKRLLTAAWLRARGEHVEILPALDGHGVDVVFRHTSKLSRRECAELSEFVMAWGSEQGVPWCAASLGRDGQIVDAETGEILEAA